MSWGRDGDERREEIYPCSVLVHLFRITLCCASCAASFEI
jgi:hypothetical protein